MVEFKKSDAIDYAHTIRLLIDALVDEEFNEEWAEDFVRDIIIAAVGKHGLF